MAQPEDIDEPLLERLYPDEPLGDLFKDDGSRADEGATARGDFTPITTRNPSCPTHTLEDRYASTYPRVFAEHRPYDELARLITDLAAARAAGPAAVRAYFQKHWDVDGLATGYAVRNWSGAWDDTHHNMFLHKRAATGKWNVIHQDFEWDFGLGKGLGFAATWNPGQTLYLGWNSANAAISKSCELPAGMTRGCNALGFMALKDAFLGAFKNEFDDKLRDLVRRGILSAEGVGKVIDEGVAKFSMDDWLATPAHKACDVDAAHTAMRRYAALRHSTVVQRLAP
jgi:hypothetical protein